MSQARDTRKLAAILVADVVGYSRLVAIDESATLAQLKALLAQLIHPAVAERSGRIFKTTGDGFLAAFDSAIDAVECAVLIQDSVRARVASDPPDRRIVFRIGINVGDVVVDGDDLHGGGVNVAARLEAAAQPGGITISSTVYDHVRDRVTCPIEDLGPISVKNIPYPIHAFRVLPAPENGAAGAAQAEPPAGRAAPAQGPPKRKRAASPTVLAAGVALCAIVASVALWRPWAPAPSASAPSVSSPSVSSPSEAPRASPVAPGGGGVRSPSEPQRSMLLVLPFANLSGDRQQEYFSDGITEDVINALARVPGFTVIARNTAFTYKGKPVNAQALGQELGVRYILEASIQRQGDRLRLNAQLVETRTGNPVWAERIDRQMADVFVVQDEIADRIVGIVASQLRRREGQRAMTANPETLDALDLTLRARHLRSASGRDETVEARRLLERAIERDPGFVGAYTVLYSVMNQFFINRWNDEFNSPTTVKRMLDLAAQAVSIAPSDPIVRATYAEGLTLVGQHEMAVKQIDAALSGVTADTDMLRLAATVMARSGEFERSVSLMKSALQLDPAMSPGNLGSPLGSSLYLLGRYAEAADYAGQCVRRAASNVLCRRWYIAALAQMGRLDDARREAAELMKLSPGLTVSEQTQRMARTYRDPAHVRHHSEGLRLAGIPD